MAKNTCIFCGDEFDANNFVCTPEGAFCTPECRDQYLSEQEREDASDRKIADLDYARDQEHEGFYRN